MILLARPDLRVFTQPTTNAHFSKETFWAQVQPKILFFFSARFFFEKQKTYRIIQNFIFNEKKVELFGSGYEKQNVAWNVYEVIELDSKLYR